MTFSCNAITVSILFQGFQLIRGGWITLKLQTGALVFLNIIDNIPIYYLPKKHSYTKDLS